jgi:hypothetical protein
VFLLMVADVGFAQVVRPSPKVSMPQDADGAPSPDRSVYKHQDEPQSAVPEKPAADAREHAAAAAAAVEQDILNLLAAAPCQTSAVVVMYGVDRAFEDFDRVARELKLPKGMQGGVQHALEPHLGALWKRWDRKRPTALALLPRAWRKARGNGARRRDRRRKVSPRSRGRSSHCRTKRRDRLRFGPGRASSLP